MLLHGVCLLASDSDDPKSMIGMHHAGKHRYLHSQGTAIYPLS